MEHVQETVVVFSAEFEPSRSCMHLEEVAALLRFKVWGKNGIHFYPTETEQLDDLDIKYL